MLNRIRKNEGMSLVEVLVSMLVLSLSVVTVMTAFSMATKTNTKSKQAQSVESLMENLTEYTRSGGADYAGWLSAGGYSLDQDFSNETPTQAVKKETFTGVKQGFFNYNVKITTDREPDEYSNEVINEHKVIQLGGTGSNTEVIALTETGMNATDESAYEMFYSLYEMGYDVEKAIYDASPTPGPGMPTPTPFPDKIEKTDMTKYVDRELWLTTVKDSTTEKMCIRMYAVYTAMDTLPYLAEEDRTWKGLDAIFTSDLYDYGNDSDAGANKLEQIYLLYPEENSDSYNLGKNMDIRILDAEADTEKCLKATIYIVPQTAMGGGLKMDDDGNVKFEEYIGSTMEIRVSCQDPEDSLTAKTPIKADIYCASGISYSGGGSGVTTFSKSLVAKGNEIRAVKVTLEIIDPTTGNVLDTETVTRLQ